MPRIRARDVDELPPELADILEAGRDITGFAPNTALESTPLRFAGDALPASHGQPVQHVPGDGERS